MCISISADPKRHPPSGIPRLTLPPAAQMICGPVRQGRFIAHLRIQLSVATLIIDAALCDFEVEEKGLSCSKTEGF